MTTPRLAEVPLPDFGLSIEQPVVPPFSSAPAYSPPFLLRPTRVMMIGAA